MALVENKNDSFSDTAETYKGPSNGILVMQEMQKACLFPFTQEIGVETLTLDHLRKSGVNRMKRNPELTFHQLERK